jgi:hypothetical protein
VSGLAGQTDAHGRQPPATLTCDYYKYYPGQSFYNDAGSYPSQGEGLGRRHGKKGGIVTGFSGHVQSISYEKFNQERLRSPVCGTASRAVPKVIKPQLLVID